MRIRFNTSSGNLEKTAREAVKLLGIEDLDCEVILTDDLDLAYMLSGIGEKLLYTYAPVKPLDTVIIVEPRRLYIIYVSSPDLEVLLHSFGHLIINYRSGISRIDATARGPRDMPVLLDDLAVALASLSLLAEDVVTDVFVYKRCHDLYRSYLERVLHTLKSVYLSTYTQSIESCLRAGIVRAAAELYRQLVENKPGPELVKVFERVDSISTPCSLAETLAPVLQVVERCVAEELSAYKIKTSIHVSTREDAVEIVLKLSYD